MAYSGATPTSVPLSGDDLSDGIISEAKLGTDAVSLAKMKAGVDGNIISYDASGNVVAIATGSDGQVLTSAGAGAPCAFEAIPSAGGWEYVSTVTASNSATVSFTNMADGYNYKYDIEHLIPITDTAQFQSKVGIAGPTYRTSLYRSTMASINTSGDSLSYEATAVMTLSGGTGQQTCGTNTNEESQVILILWHPANASDKTTWQSDGVLLGADAILHRVSGSGLYTTAEAQTSLQFLFSSGNISSGTFSQYRQSRT